MANDRDEEETETEDELDSEEEELDEDEEEEEESDEDDSEDDSDEGSDDDGDSDDEDGDEDDSDDSDGDEDDSDEDEDDVEAASAKARPRRKASGSKRKTGSRRAKGKERPTAGTRLAAARAAKAARKAAKRGVEKKEEEAPVEQVAETELGQKAAQAAEWTAANRQMVIGIAAAVLLALGGWIGWYYWDKGQREAAGEALADAVEISRATLRGEDEPAPDDDDPPSYTSADARAEAALEAFQRVIQNHAGTEAAAWAQLGAGNALTELERYGEARTAFEAAIAQGGGDSTIVWRALEGKGFTFEAEEEWAQALAVYEELSRLDDSRYEPVAKYHTARMYVAQGETEQATETLTELVTDLREAEEDDERQGFAYVLAQAEVRLRELDPDAVPARPTLGGGPLGGGAGGPGGPGGGDISPEQLQELMRRLQQQGGGAEE